MCSALPIYVLEAARHDAHAACSEIVQRSPRALHLPGFGRRRASGNVELSCPSTALGALLRVAEISPAFLISPLWQAPARLRKAAGRVEAAPHGDHCAGLLLAARRCFGFLGARRGRLRRACAFAFWQAGSHAAASTCSTEWPRWASSLARALARWGCSSSGIQRRAPEPLRTGTSSRA